MFYNNPVIAKTNPFFVQTQELIKPSSTLLRIVQLSNALPANPASRNSSIQSLLELCGKVHLIAIENLENAHGEMLDGLEEISDPLYTIYNPLFGNASSDPESFRAKVSQVIRDVKSVQVPPVRKSHRGYEGPTLLASYPKFDLSNHTVGHKEAVIKWTNSFEVVSHKIYSYISELINREPFSVPKATSLDFQAKIHSDLGGGYKGVLDKEVEFVFAALKKSVVDPRDFSDKEVMIFERIDGANLFDFLSSKYPFLSLKQKKDLFEKFGEIAMADLILGNSDRFIRFGEGFDGEYCLETFAANFGNVVIRWEKERDPYPTVFAIDNGIDRAIGENPKQGAKYDRFITNLIESETVFDQLAQNMIDTFKGAVEAAFEEGEMPTPEMRVASDQFSGDLDEIAKDSFRVGLKKMARRLKEVVEPNWASGSNSMKESLGSYIPGLFEGVDERIAVIKKMKILNGVKK